MNKSLNSSQLIRLFNTGLGFIAALVILSHYIAYVSRSGSAYLVAAAVSFFAGMSFFDWVIQDEFSTQLSKNLDKPSNLDDARIKSIVVAGVFWGIFVFSALLFHDLSLRDYVSGNRQSLAQTLSQVAMGLSASGMIMIIRFWFF